jgi:CRISPR system Cascade subunit CasA
MRFNLIDEPFIPCLLTNGSCQELSLQETLLQAHEINELRGDTPVVTVSLHRLLLALLHRCFGPKSQTEWRRLWAAGQFDAQRLSSYLSLWRHRFDLFDAERPFYQTGGMTTAKPLPAAALFDELACNHNDTLFDHSFNDDGQAFTPAQAARGLITRQGFALGLGVSPDVIINGKTIKTGNRKDGPLARGLLVMLCSDNLFRTLLLNLTRLDPSEDDLPVWERDDPDSILDQTRTAGRLDLYTFQCRRLRLVAVAGASGPLVTQVHFAQGRSLDPEELDPMKPYRRDPDRGWLLFSISEEKATWRESSALLEMANDRDRPVPALNWVAQAARDGIVPRHAVYNLETFAAATQPRKPSRLILWRHDHLPLPLDYLNDPDLLAALKLALGVAEDVAKVLRTSVWHLARLALFPGKEAELTRLQQADANDMVDSLAPERLYWSRLEVRFREFLVSLPSDGTPEQRATALASWFAEVIRPAALRAFVETAGEIDHSARTLRAAAVAEQRLHAGLARVAKERSLSPRASEGVAS